MHPILLKLGPLTIHTYGFFVALGFLTGILMAKKEAVRVGENPEQIMDLCFYILISSVIGARLFYVFTMPGHFFKNPLEIFKIWEGGLVFYGGFISALVFAIVYLKKHRIEIWKIADLLAPSLAIGHALGRIGCFFAGCCYGKICELPWAVTFSHPESLAPLGISLHPTQLYEAFSNFTIFAILWMLRIRKQFEGQVFWVYVMIYGSVRSILEIFRDDFRGGFMGPLSPSQVIGIAMAIAAGIMLVRCKRADASGYRRKNRVYRHG